MHVSVDSRVNCECKNEVKITFNTLDYMTTQLKDIFSGKQTNLWTKPGDDKTFGRQSLPHAKLKFMKNEKKILQKPKTTRTAIGVTDRHSSRGVCMYIHA